MTLAPGTLVINPGRVFHNAALGSFTIENDAMITGEGIFENSSFFRRTTSPGIATVDLDFRNSGTVSLETGTTIFHEYRQTAGTTDLAGGNLGVVHELVEVRGGILKGKGMIDASVVVSQRAAVLAPISPDDLTITGSYRQSFPSTLYVQIAGSLQFPRIVVQGQAILGGSLEVDFLVTPGFDIYPVMQYASRVGEFTELDLPPPPAGGSWLTRYTPVALTLLPQVLLPTDPLRVDRTSVFGGNGNLNQVFDPGELVSLEPTWTNPSPVSDDLAAASIGDFAGPPGATYAIPDFNGSYVDLFANGGTAGCLDCYAISVDNPAVRPAPHWDATLNEGVWSESILNVASYSIHVGGSFGDVAQIDPFYRFIETLLHNQVTTGCGGDSYCPTSFVTRAQMAVFLMVSKFGPSYLPPAATGTVFADVPLGSFAAAFIEDIASRQITSGCGGGNYCPGDSATREQMAVFLLRTLEGPLYVPPDCTEPPTFTDVPCSNGFAKWIEELVLRGITAGCGGGLYCPAQPVTRGQMAVFLTATFGLRLNGA
jgi:hypothetical protein